jgi:hypothetical protein
MSDSYQNKQILNESLFCNNPLLKCSSKQGENSRNEDETNNFHDLDSSLINKGSDIIHIIE